MLNLRKHSCVAPLGANHRYVRRLLPGGAIGAFRRDSMALICHVARYFVCIMVFLQSGLVHSETVNIGIMAADKGVHRWIGEQIKAGVAAYSTMVESKCDKFADKHDFKLNLSYSKGALNTTEAVLAAYKELSAKDVHVIVGGAIPIVATALRAASSSDKIPTILLSETLESLTKPARKSKHPKHILQLGLSQADVYAKSFEYWLSSEKNLKVVSSVYDADHKSTQLYGQQLTPSIIRTLVKAPSVMKVPFPTEDVTKYASIVKRVQQKKPDAIVISGWSLDTENLVAGLSKKIDRDIYVAPPMNVADHASRLAKVSYTPIHFGAEFLPNLKNQCHEKFVSEVRQQLGWSEKAPISIPAIKAYDALRVIRSAGLPGDWKSWTHVAEVQGLTGKLKTLDAYGVMAGPLHLVSAGPGIGLKIQEIPGKIK